MKHHIPLIVLLLFGTGKLFASSFTADAVQLRDGKFNYAKMYWTDKRVRFDYVDQGVSMAQIFDEEQKKVVWLDTENKLFIERDLSNAVSFNKKTKSIPIKNPCEHFKNAECTKIKDVVINDRSTVKWLVTINQFDEEQHMFLWIDKKLGLVLRQDNPDGSRVNVIIKEDADTNDRPARKLDMFAIAPDGSAMHLTQWIDKKLGVVIRQIFADGSMDELRNIKAGKIQPKRFKIPDGYKRAGQEQPSLDKTTVSDKRAKQ